ncbi:MAG: exopolysaccharide biosynthesis polyprenyl glycosylphosphotransferase [Solirubrobacteraceae bacterium]|nr:exopolysaccharide biosynthesis polyprenyl glycosylphosphotransferase [Solirubrobacteraceae bacterium]
MHRPAPVARTLPPRQGPASRVPLMVTADLLALTIAAAAAFDLVIPPHAIEDFATLAFPFVGIVLLGIRRAYRWSPRDAALDHVLPIIGGLGVATLICLGLADLGGNEPAPRPWLGVWILGSLLVVAQRAVLGLYHRARLLRGAGQRPTLIVGAGAIGARLARRLAGAPDYGLSPIGFLDDRPLPEDEVGGRPAPLLGGLEDLDRVIAEHHVEQVVVAFSSAPDRAVVELVRRCEEMGVEVALVPRLFDLWNHRAAYDPIGGLPVLHMRGTDLRGWQFAVKAVLDRTVAALALLVLLPVLALIALGVRISSPGPVLFRQRRVGLDGTEFDLLKFRSMRMPTAEELAATEDRGAMAPGGVEGVDRRTKLGAFMRRSSLDELPQLINVLRGEMSMVGPRPERPEFVDRFRFVLDRYDERHRVKSGITGWAQIHGLRGRTSLADRIEMDNFYIEHFSLALDLRIIVRTLVVVFRAAE